MWIMDNNRDICGGVVGLTVHLMEQVTISLVVKYKKYTIFGTLTPARSSNNSGYNTMNII